MAENNQSADAYKPSVFRRNQDDCMEQVQALYTGKHVAWSMDGKKILACGDDMGEVFRELDRLGIPTSRVVVDYINDPNISNF